MYPSDAFDHSCASLCRYPPATVPRWATFSPWWSTDDTMELPPDVHAHLTTNPWLFFYKILISLCIYFLEHACWCLPRQTVTSFWLQRSAIGSVCLLCEYDVLHALLASMMFYHDGLRTIAAEKARHSSNSRATPLTFIFIVVTLNFMLISIFLFRNRNLWVLSIKPFPSPNYSKFTPSFSHPLHANPNVWWNMY